MRSIEMTAFGADGLRHVERPRPVAQPGQVVVRIQAAALNYRDVEIIEGRYGMPVRLPIVPLSDAVGVVCDIGEGVSEWTIGDRVNPVFFPGWLDGEFDSKYFAHQLGGTHDGVLREFMAVPANSVVHAPRHLGDEAAALPIAALTAWSAMKEANLSPGQTVLVIGTGGVALFALQFAKMFGARAVVLSSSDSKIARALELGAREGVNYRAVPDWGRQVTMLTDGAGVDLVIETGGAATFPQSVYALKPGGTIAVIGYLSGSRIDMDLREIFIGKRARLQGHTVGSARQFDAMNRAMEVNGIVPVIDSRFSVERAKTAYDRMASGETFGKVLITLS